MADDGSVVGQQASDKILVDITRSCAEINPVVPPSIERVELPGSAGLTVLLVSVPAGTAKPYSYRGRHYVRSGASTVEMANETEVSLVLERVHALNRWETSESGQELAALNIDEIAAFRDDAISNGRAQFDRDAVAEVVLRSMGLLDSDGKPNRAALVLFGRSSSLIQDFPMVGVHLVAVRGTSLAQEFADEERVEANVFESLRRSMAFVEGHLRHPVKIEGMYARQWLEIPELVIREALANALAHRDYTVGGRIQVRVFADRVEVVSIGAGLWRNSGREPSA